MTAPRRILPGVTYLVTRRCAGRQFLLRPSATTSAIFRYVLAVAAERFGIQVHAFCVLSNHWHAVVTDPDARLPAFEQYLDSLVARAVNASLGRWESFWAPSSYSAVALTSPADVLDKAAYVLANPVAAGLVQRGLEWPGLWSAPELIGGDPIAAARPKVFFSDQGLMPEKAHLSIVPPPGFTAEEFRSKLEFALGELEVSARKRLASEGRTVLGVKRVLAQKATARPAAGEPRRGLNPRVGARDKWKRIEALARLTDFLKSYRAAWTKRRAGESHEFPAGTYHLRVFHAAPCAAVT
jgi:REP-associated tyrosine transposase